MMILTCVKNETQERQLNESTKIYIYDPADAC